MMKLAFMAVQNAHNGDSDRTGRTKAGRTCTKVLFSHVVDQLIEPCIIEYDAQ